MERWPPSQLPAELIPSIERLFSRNASNDTLTQYVRRSAILSEYLLDRDKARTFAEALAASHIPQYSHRLLVLAQRLGCQFKQNAYECVAYQLAEARHWSLILPVVSLGLRHTGRTTPRLLNWRARALGETQHFAALSGILEEFAQHKLKPTRRTYHILIAGHIRNHDLARARDTFQRMESSGFPVDTSTHALVVSVYRSMGPDAQVMAQAFASLASIRGPPATSVVNELMQLRLDARDLPGALQILALFDQKPTSPVPEPSPTGDSILGDGKPPPDEMEALSPISPNAKTFSILVNYMAKVRDLPRALMMVKRMNLSNISPDAGVMAALVNAYFMGEKPGLAVQTVTDICKPRKNNRLLFRRLAIPTQEQLPLDVSKMKPSIEVFNALLKGILSTRGLKGAYVVLRLMHAYRIRPDATSVEITITHIDKTKRARPRDLLRIFRHLTVDIRPTIRHVDVLLRALFRKEKFQLLGSGWDATGAKFSRMREDTSQYPEGRISSNSKSFDPTAGIEVPQHSSYRSLMKTIIQSLSDRNVKSSRRTVALRIYHDGIIKADLESARNVFKTLLARGMHPNEYHFSALIQGYARCGDMRGAENVLQSAARAGVTPNVVMFTNLVVGYGQLGKPDLATRAFQSMLVAGIKPDVPAIDAVSSAFFAVGAYAMARQVLINLWPYIQPFPPELVGATLKQLIRTFRTLHGDQTGTPMKVPKRQRKMMHWKLRQLSVRWHSWRVQSKVKKRFVVGSSLISRRREDLA